MDETQQDERPVRHVTTFADLTAVEPEWLWDGRIPMGEVTLVVAKGGTGKTFAVLDLAARVTRGDAMPGGAGAGPEGSVVLVSGDDDPAAVLAWRLKAAGADLARVIDWSEPDGAPFRMGGKASMIPGLHEMVAARGDVRLVIIDPLARCSAVATTAVKTVNVELMNPLRAMARKTGCAVVLIHHETKAGTVAGGQGLYDSARSLLRVDKGEDGVRSVRVEKSSMARDDAEPVRYRLTGSSWASTRVEWLGEDTQAAREGTPAEHRILMALASSSRGLTLQKLASMTGLPYDSVRVLMTRLKGKGLAVNAIRGVWVLNGERVRVISEAQHKAEQAAREQEAAPELVPHKSGYGLVAANGGQS
jgi:KaiC/GvpD/RAD55 family RecA-like ATPase